jgi:hypothetical protein
MYPLWKKYFWVIIFLLIIADSFYSFNQFYHTKLDGDLARGIVPENDCKKLLKDPFGFNVLLNGDHYAGTNRFFTVWIMNKYFRTAPFLLQKFVNPVDSIYLSCVIAKLFIQMLLVFLISVYASISNSFNWRSCLFVSFLIIPLFQTNGYNSYMGVIDKSVSYSFSYALPIACLLLYFLPFYFVSIGGYSFKLPIITNTLICMGAVILAFSSPIIQGIILIVCTMIILPKWVSNFKEIKNQSFLKKVLLSFFMISQFYLLHFLFIGILCLYSFYIGLYNIENLTHILPLADRYVKIPIGLYYLLTRKLGYPVLLLMIFTNLIIIKKAFYDNKGITILKLARWIAIFSFLYICLIPLGGFRIYRPNILRYDTVIPITIALIFLYGLSSYFLLKHFYQQRKWLYAAITLCFLSIYINADKSDSSDYLCERAALQEICTSNKDTVELNSSCSVLAWDKITDYKESELNAQLLFYWGITDKKKLYYQK